MVEFPGGKIAKTKDASMFFPDLVKRSREKVTPGQESLEMKGLSRGKYFWSHTVHF